MQLTLHLVLLGLDRFVPPQQLGGESASGSDEGADEVVEDEVEIDADSRRMLAAASTYCGSYASVWAPTTAGSGCEFLYFLDWRAVASMTALLTFFIVFYGSQSYARFRFFYSHCVGLGGVTMNWTTLVRNHLPRDRQLQWNATRLILLSMHLLYYTLKESDSGASISGKEEATLFQRELLTPVELKMIKAYKGYKPYLPLIWAQREVGAAIQGSTGLPDWSVDGQLMHHFRELAFAFRGHCGQITNELAEPVPFPYFHMLTLQLFANMLGISWALVTLRFHPLLTAVIYAILLTLFIGLKEVAVQMSNPFGDDAVDFDVARFCRGAYNNSVAILQDEWVPHSSTVAPVQWPRYAHDELGVGPRMSGNTTGTWPSLTLVAKQQQHWDQSSHHSIVPQITAEVKQPAVDQLQQSLAASPNATSGDESTTRPGTNGAVSPHAACRLSVGDTPTSEAGAPMLRRPPAPLPPPKGSSASSPARSPSWRARSNRSGSSSAAAVAATSAAV